MSSSYLGPSNTTFSSIVEYLQHIAEQEWRHLNEQLNSVDSEQDARLHYTFWCVFEKLVPRFISHDYDRGPFKLICYEFGPANMMVNNTKDLKIVAVLDWEWSYAGLYQLFCCPPRWLVLDRSNQWAHEDGRVQLRYIKYLDIFIQALEMEEMDTPQDVAPMEESLSTMMKERKGWQMWFHHIIWEGSDGPTCVPFNTDEFVKMKMQHLIDYKRKLDSYGDAVGFLR